MKGLEENPLVAIGFINISQSLSDVWNSGCKIGQPRGQLSCSTCGWSGHLWRRGHLLLVRSGLVVGSPGGCKYLAKVRWRGGIQHGSGYALTGTKQSATCGSRQSEEINMIAIIGGAVRLEDGIATVFDASLRRRWSGDLQDLLLVSSVPVHQPNVNLQLPCGSFGEVGSVQPMTQRLASLCVRR